jgi:hypothetical protein
MYHVTFSFGRNINVGRCVISSSTDTTITSYYESTSSSFQDFTSLKIVPGHLLYINTQNYSNVLLGRVSAVTATTITLATNPGVYAYEQVLQNGFIEIYVKTITSLYSYRQDKYCGALLTKQGENYRAYSLTSSIDSDAITVTSNSIISLYFEKPNGIDEVRVNVQEGNELNALQAINQLITNEKNVDFSTFISTQDNKILSINGIVSNTATDNY